MTRIEALKALFFSAVDVALIIVSSIAFYFAVGAFINVLTSLLS